MPTQQFATIYLTRHGQTEWNRDVILQGQGDSPLTELGQDQARQIAALLKDVHLAHIYSSDLLRAQRTAEIIAAEKKVTHAMSNLVRERNYGRFDGKDLNFFLTELKESIAAMEALPDAEQAQYRLAEDIETDVEIVSRMLRFLREIATVHIGQNVLVVCHSEIIRATLVHLGYGTYQEIDHVFLQHPAYVKLKSVGTEFFVEETFNVIKK